jgi:two-component SAPR family response regulator
MTAETSPFYSKEHIKALESAVNLYTGTFLGDLYNDWIETRRRELENKYLKALSILADYYAEKEQYSRAVSLLEKYVGVDPYDMLASRREK